MLVHSALLATIAVIIAADLNPVSDVSMLKRRPLSSPTPGEQDGLSFEHCRLVCDPDASLWSTVNDKLLKLQ